MSVFFSSDFSSLAAFTGGDGSASNIPYKAHTIPLIGCAAGPLFTCSGSSTGGNVISWVYETFASNLATLTLRGQVGGYTDGSLSSNTEYLIFRTENRTATPNAFTVPEVNAGFWADGSVFINVDASSSDENNSGSGVFVMDGLPHGYQLLLTETSTTMSWDIEVDDVQVFTGVTTFNTANTHYLGRGYFFANRFPNCGLYSNAQLKGYVNGMSSFSYVECDNTASVASFPACSGSTAITTNTCWNPFTLSSIACDTELNTLEFNGIGLYGGPVPAPGFPTIQIYGPNGGQLIVGSFDVLTDTQVVATITGQYDEDFNILPFTVIPGHYCVYVINVCA